MRSPRSSTQALTHMRITLAPVRTGSGWLITPPLLSTSKLSKGFGVLLVTAPPSAVTAVGLYLMESPGWALLVRSNTVRESVQGIPSPPGQTSGASPTFQVLAQPESKVTRPAATNKRMCGLICMMKPWVFLLRYFQAMNELDISLSTW